MKLAITGKGGVGKTTTSSLIVMALKAIGREVIAIDADPDSNLAATMGYAEAASIKPLVELQDLIEDRTGVKPGTTGGMFRLNPFVADIPDLYAVDIDGVKLLVAGAVKKGGSGCYCPENSVLRALVSHLLLDDNMDLVLDMEAGVEHLGRATVGSIDQLIVVVNPGLRSIETALRIKVLAEDIGLTRIGAIANMVRSDKDLEFIEERLEGVRLIGALPYDEDVRSADMNGQRAWGISKAVDSEVSRIVDQLIR